MAPASHSCTELLETFRGWRIEAESRFDVVTGKDSRPRPKGVSERQGSWKFNPVVKADQ